MMKVEIKNKNKNIICKITALEFDHVDCGKRVYMTTKQVKRLLIEKGHNPGNIIKESRVDNCNNEIEGTWEFNNGNFKEKIYVEKVEVVTEKTSEDLELEIPKQTKTTNRRKNSRKSKK